MEDGKYKMTKKREKAVGGPKKMKRKNNVKSISRKIIKEAKGVTLISLVITIIILLILAGVTLSLTLGDNGIITQAQKAKEAQEIAAIKEDFQLAILDKELEKGGTGLTKEELEEIAGNYGEIQEDGNTIKTNEGYEIKIDEIYQEGATGGGSGSSDEEIAALEEKIKELEQTVEDLNNTKTELEGTIENLNGQLAQVEGDKTLLQEQVNNLTEQVANLTTTKEQLEATINDLNTQIAELQKKQSKGTAVAADVLKGKTFSNSSDIEITGTMENRGAVNKTLNAGGSYTIPAGYHNGSGKVTAKSLKDQTAGTAKAEWILDGRTAWINGVKVTGTLPNLQYNSTIYHTSSNESKVVLGDAAFVSTNSDGVNRVQIRYNGPDGYIGGNTLFAVDFATMAHAIGLTADKIVAGQTILGITGTGR